MAKLNARVKASTLLEVIVAMVIILIVFTLAIGIYNNVLSSGNSARKTQMNALMAHLMIKSINEQNWNDQEILQDRITFRKTVLPYEKYTDLVLITITAFEHDRQIGQSRQIVKKTADEH